MKNTVSVHRSSLSKHLAFCALFASLCCVSTLLILIPLPNGYFNTGDVFVLLSGWILGVWGIPAAAIGSALADIISGFAIYAPATFLIKGGMAFLAYLVWRWLKRVFKKSRFNGISLFLSALLAETVMVAGYFLFECILYGFAGAALSLTGNAIQGGACALCGTALYLIVSSIPALNKFFPALDEK